MRIQYISRLTAATVATLRPVAPILVVAGGAVPTMRNAWDHIVTVSDEDRQVAVDAGGLRFLTMPFGADSTGRLADFEWLMRELDIARTDTVPVVCVSRGAPGFFLAAGTALEATVLPHIQALLREPLRAWIVGETQAAVNVSWGAVRGGSNPFGVPGYCGEIFMDVSTDAVREVPLLAQVMGGRSYGMYRIR
jgi:hypothetical protein